MESKIIEPERLPVSQRRQWLVQFVENQRMQNERHKLPRDKARQEKKGEHRVGNQNLDQDMSTTSAETISSFGESFSSTSSHQTESHFLLDPSMSCNDLSVKDHPVALTRPAPTPIFRDFAIDKAPTPSDSSYAGSKITSKDIENYRVVSVQKLPEDTKPRPSRDFSPLNSELADSHGIHVGWNLSFRPHRTISEGEDEDGSDDVDNDNEGKLGTGRQNGNPGNIFAATMPFTEPSAHHRSGNRERGQKDGTPDMENEGEMESVTTGKFRRKIPMILCKSTKDEERDSESSHFDSESSHFDFRAKPTPRDRTDGYLVPARFSPSAASMLRSRQRVSPPNLNGEIGSIMDNSLAPGTRVLLGARKPNETKHAASSKGATSSIGSGDGSSLSVDFDPKIGDIFEREDLFHLQREQQAKCRQVCNSKATDTAGLTKMSNDSSGQGGRIITPSPKPRTLFWPSPSPSSPTLPWSSQGKRTNSSSPLEEGSSPGRVRAAIEQFGGKARSSTSVQSRKDEIEQKCAANRQPSFVKKVKWQPGQNNGSYQKKLLIVHKKNGGSEGI